MHVHSWLKSPVFVLLLSHVAMERAAKLRRLEELRRNNPHISATALAEVISDLEQHGLPDLHSRKHVQEARDSLLLPLMLMALFSPRVMSP